MDLRLHDDEYYQARAVEHTAQGDFYADVPCVYSTDETKRNTGARKRPSVFGRLGLGPDHPPPRRALAVVCSYTCGFVAQPPGQRGYSHSYRLVAPVIPLVNLIGGGGLKRTAARRVKESGHQSGLLYVPRPTTYTPAIKPLNDHEFTDDDYAVLLYAMTNVDQAILNSCRCVARLSQHAQMYLTSALIEVVSPAMYYPDTLPEPDMSDSWNL